VAQPHKVPAAPDSSPKSESPRVIGRYAVYGEIGSGGMATVYFGRLRGAGGFSRPVAIKRLHPHFAKTPRFVDAFLDEARLAAQIRHPNVVPTLDVVAEENELLLVMEYIAGASLSELWDMEVARGGRIAPRIAAAILAGALHGLHAAHEANDDDGKPLSIVHREVSPHNGIVGTDGTTRVLDFGVAKAEQRIRTTNPGEVKGKLAYMAPEQIMLEHASPRSDLYAAGVVLWEALTGQLLFRAENHGSLISKILSDVVKPPSEVVTDAGDSLRALDAIVMKALARNAEERYASAREMALALEEVGCASTREVAEWVLATAGEAVARRAERAAAVERARPSAVDALWEVSEIDALDAANKQTENTDATGEHQASEEEAEAPPPVVMHEEPKRRRAIVAVVIAVIVLGGVAAWTTMRTPQVAVPPPPTATASATTVATASAKATATGVATATASATATTSATATATPSTTTTTTAIAPATAKAPASTAAPAPSPKRPDCSPPYTVDADGIKHLKRECL
jgi:serine/threonine-protein kinase